MASEGGQFWPTVGMCSAQPQGCSHTWRRSRVSAVLVVLLKSTICIPGGRHGRSRAGGQRASLLCAAESGSELGWVEEGAGIRLRFFSVHTKDGMEWEFTQRSRMGLILHYHLWLQKGGSFAFLPSVLCPRHRCSCQGARSPRLGVGRAG